MVNDICLSVIIIVIIDQLQGRSNTSVQFFKQIEHVRTHCSRMHPKWQPIHYLVHYFWPGPMIGCHLGHRPMDELASGGGILTYLSVGHADQSVVHQLVCLWAPGLTLHNVTLSRLIGQWDSRNLDPDREGGGGEERGRERDGEREECERMYDRQNNVIKLYPVNKPTLTRF